MDESRNISDYMPQLTYALMKSGATPFAINSFRAYRYTLPRHASKLPCPHCFSGGRQGWLDIVKDGDIITSLKCDVCREEILLKTGSLMIARAGQSDA